MSASNTIFQKPRIGLALSGGGARGLAHIGVLKVLEREGIEIHALAGTSMGAVIGAAYAAGMSPNEMQQEALRMSRLSELARLVEWFPPKGKLFDSNRVRQFLEDRLHLDIDFADLQLPLTVIAVDLHKNEQVVLNEGSVLAAVEASAALPGLFKPVEYLDTRLVDGGVLNNLPVDQLAPLGANRTLAVDVGFHQVSKNPTEHIPILRTLPEVATEFYQVGAMMVSELTRQRLRDYPPDVVIEPALPTGSGVLWGFLKPQEIIDCGEAAAEAALDDLLKLTSSGPRAWFRSLGRRGQ